MDKKIVSLIISGLFLASILSSTISIIPAVAAPITDVYVSDDTNQWWSGATAANIDGLGYLIPPSTGWQSAAYCWEHPAWSAVSITGADWIWGPVQGADNKVYPDSTYTGEIVFFKKTFDIPATAFIQSATLSITADNAMYFYVNDDWSGIPPLLQFESPDNGFEPGYDPTNFYYEADGTDQSGGTNSVVEETVGFLYPYEASVESDIGGSTYPAGQWGRVQTFDLSTLVTTGSNELQIVAVNEHAPPQLDGNPGGLIYKLEVTYLLPMITKTIAPDNGYLGDELTVTLTVNDAPLGEAFTVEDVMPSFLSYVIGSLTVDGVPTTPTVADSTLTIPITGTGSPIVIVFDVLIDSVEAAPVTEPNLAILKYDDTPIDDDDVDVTAYPYEGFEKRACLIIDGDTYIDLNEDAHWLFVISVTNTYSWTMTNVVVTDRLAAELEVDNVISIPTGTLEFNGVVVNEGDNFSPEKGNIKITWDIGSLTAAETATLLLEISTDLNPGQGRTGPQQEYTSPDDYVLNSGATLKFTNPETIQLSAHTPVIEFTVPGEWPYCTCDPTPVLLNGGFESPVVATTQGWDIYPSSQVDWTVAWADAYTEAPATALLELHRGVNGWSPYEGSQHAELDTDWGGPGDPQSGEEASVRIAQNLATCPGQLYTLTFAWSPRPQHADNVLEVYWDGVLIATFSGSGSANINTVWTPETITDLPGSISGGTTELAFVEAGTPDSLGMFLDAVSVTRQTS